MKPLKLSDLNIILPFLDKADYEGYNSNFVTMMMWNHEYHIDVLSVYQNNLSMFL